MNILQKTLLFITVLTGTLVFACTTVPVYAVFEGAKGEACKGANLNDNDSNCKSDAASTTIDTRLQDIVNIISIIVGVVAVILIIINGLKFITSNGDSNSVTSARNGVIYAIVGLIVAALAQIIVRFVLARI